MKPKTYHDEIYSHAISTYIDHRKRTHRIASIGYDLNRIRILESFLQPEESAKASDDQTPPATSTLESATADDINTFLDSLKQHHSPQQIEGMKVTLLDLFDVLVREKIIASNPLLSMAGTLSDVPSEKGMFSEEVAAYVVHRTQRASITNIPFDLKRIEVFETFLRKRGRTLRSATEEDHKQFFEQVKKRFSIEAIGGFQSTLDELYDILLAEKIVDKKRLTQAENDEWEALERFQKSDSKKNKSDEIPLEKISAREILKPLPDEQNDAKSTPDDMDIMGGRGSSRRVAYLSVGVGVLILAISGAWYFLSASDRKPPPVPVKSIAKQTAKMVVKEEISRLDANLEEQIKTMDRLQEETRRQEELRDEIEQLRLKAEVKRMEGRLIAQSFAREMQAERHKKELEEALKKPEAPPPQPKTAVVEKKLPVDPNCIKGDCREGHGIFRFLNGEKYVGNWSNGTINGQGTRFYANGDRYVGNWLNGLRHGDGTMFYKNGDRFVGSWAHDKKGKGTKYLEFAELKEKIKRRMIREKKKAALKRQYQSGQGGQKGKTKTTSTGTKDSSKDNLELTLDEKSLLAKKRREKATGCVLNDCQNGRGAYFYSAGDEYLGMFKDGKRHGYGAYTFKSGDRYLGDWVDGKKHGTGTVIFASGKKVKGRFKSDVMVARY